MTVVATRTRITLCAIGMGFAELRAQFTVPEWIAGLLLRMLAQVLFFGLVGRFVGGPALARYMVLGNSVSLVAFEATFVVMSTMMERAQGTLILLAASPAGPANVYLARGVQWVCSGAITSTIALLSVPVVLGVPVDVGRLPAVFPLLLLTGLSCYAYACVFATIALRNPSLMWLLLNLGYLVITTLCGVNVPVLFWPGWLRHAVDLLPMTHGLTAIRSILDGGSIVDALPDAGWELLVAAGWFVFALALARRLMARSRADGSFDFFG